MTAEVKVPDHAQLAGEAFRRAQAANNPAEARRWLDRACRLAPADDTLRLALATALLGADDRRAADLYAALAATHDVRELWLGLATASRRLDDSRAAAAALAAALARHSLHPRHAGLADQIALEAGAPGWCGLAGDGSLIVRALPADRPLTTRLDDTPLGRRVRRVPWLNASRISVTTDDGMHLLGSPISLHAIARTEGVVACRDGGIDGWAWHPGDPEADPVITVRSLDGRHEFRVRATANDAAGPTALLARPRGFRVSAERLAPLGAIRVLGRDGGDLLGSPLDPAAEQRHAAVAAASLACLYPVEPLRRRVSPLVPPPAIPADTTFRRSGRKPNRKRIAVVIPVHDGRYTRSCLESVLASVAPPNRVIVVDDKSRDPDLVRALDQLAMERRIRLIRNQRNLGFVASANAGIAAARGYDVLLLNSDTLVPPGWLEDLAAAAYSAPDIGTVTPLSNDATIASYPGAARDGEVLDAKATRHLAALAKRANGSATVEIPVAVGFCMFIRHDCLAEVGLLRADVFAQGYGEENDFCLRARHLGWRHIAAPGVFVAHVGSGSFGTAARYLQTRNQALLERLHPGYGRMVEAHLAADPLAEARRRLDTLRWRAARERAGSVVLIAHDAGGGVERGLRTAMERHGAEGRRAIVLRPAQLHGGKAVVIADATGERYPDLRFALPDELPALRRLLAAERPVALELHHLVGHHVTILELIPLLGVPYDVHVHDYAWLCGRIALVGRDERYCGEPEVARCESCIADAGSMLDEEISVAALRQRSAKLLAGARHVLVPSQDAAARIRRYFPSARIVVAPHEDEASIAQPAPPRHLGGRCRVAVIGAIGIHKGYQVLLDCARHAAENRLPLDFVVVGHTIDDNRLMATGRVFVTGQYVEEEAMKLVRSQQATLAWLPSICPETWHYALTEAWRAGLHAVVFDIGAQAERIRRTGRGILLPLGLPPHGINAALLAASGLSR